VGMFRVEVTAVGGHGCQRTVRDGQQVQNFCGSTSCPDCIAREFIRSLKRAGVSFEPTYECNGFKHGAVIRHWPGDKTEVVDDLLTGARTGSF
jgi:hypothetical protein